MTRNIAVFFFNTFCQKQKIICCSYTNCETCCKPCRKYRKYYAFTKSSSKSYNHFSSQWHEAHVLPSKSIGHPFNQYPTNYRAYKKRELVMLMIQLFSQTKLNWAVIDKVLGSVNFQSDRFIEYFQLLYEGNISDELQIVLFFLHSHWGLRATKQIVIIKQTLIIKTVIPCA